MNKKITTVSVLALVLGLFTQLIPLFSFTLHPWITKTVKIVREVSPNIDLLYISPHLFRYYNFDTGFETNFIDLFIYVLILFGTIFYLKSRGKKIRLLRFSFAIILIAKALVVFKFLVSRFLYSGFFLGETLEIALKLLPVLSSILWAWAAYFVLKSLSKNTSLRSYKTEDNAIEYVDSSKSQRLLHHILDLVLSTAIFSKAVVFFFTGFLRQIEDHFGGEIAVYCVIIISRIVYSILFEFMFKATPAKFLTGSKIIMKDGGSVSLQTAVFRNLARHVPFEALSYLGKGNGWHDRWLNTRVVKEGNLEGAAKNSL